jgi:hypothetical protein
MATMAAVTKAVTVVGAAVGRIATTINDALGIPHDFRHFCAFSLWVTTGQRGGKRGLGLPQRDPQGQRSRPPRAAQPTKEQKSAGLPAGLGCGMREGVRPWRSRRPPPAAWLPLVSCRRRRRARHPSARSCRRACPDRYLTEDDKRGHIIRMDDGSMAVRSFEK